MNRQNAFTSIGNDWIIMGLLLVLLLMHIACRSTSEQLPFFNSADFSPEWIAPTETAYDQIHYIPAFSFQNQEGETITEKTFAQKIYVADFFFTTCPGICSKLTKNMSILQEAFKEDEEVLLLSHTVTPWIDSIPRLKEYATDHGVLSGKWHLVTGEEAEIYQLARQSYFAEMEAGLGKSVDDFLHTENFVLVDHFRRIRGVYNGTLPLDVQRLIEDIRVLKREG